MIKDGVLKKLKPLTISQIRTLKNEGVDVFKLEVNTENMSETLGHLELVAELFVSASEIDGLTFVELATVVKKIISLSLQQEVDLEKN